MPADIVSAAYVVSAYVVSADVVYDSSPEYWYKISTWNRVKIVAGNQLIASCFYACVPKSYSIRTNLGRLRSIVGKLLDTKPRRTDNS